jgi:DNA/RNA-binding domain of Phe-tRNA-synthetase-like protein
MLIPFAIDDQIVERFPAVQVLALRTRVPDQRSLIPALDALGPDIERAIESLAAFDPITSMHEVASWRDAYGKLGVKPSKYPSSIEALLRRAKKGEMAETGIPAVDLYNSVSVVHRAPLGAYDAKKLDVEPITLRLADPERDQFEPLGGRPDGFPLNPDLVVYAQNADILCWGFNTRDCAKMAVDQSSADILFFSETTTVEGRTAAEAALTKLAALISKHGGTVSEITVFGSGKKIGRV